MDACNEFVNKSPAVIRITINVVCTLIYLISAGYTYRVYHENIRNMNLILFIGWGIESLAWIFSYMGLGDNNKKSVVEAVFELIGWILSDTLYLIFLWNMFFTAALLIHLDGVNKTQQKIRQQIRNLKQLRLLSLSCLFFVGMVLMINYTTLGTDLGLKYHNSEWYAKLLFSFSLIDYTLEITMGWYLMFKYAKLQGILRRIE